MTRIDAKTAARFWKFVDRRGPGECWPWNGGKVHNGYGQFHVSWTPRVQLRSHRVAYEIARGPIPNGMAVLHTCESVACCNPSHLRLGSPK